MTNTSGNKGPVCQVFLMHSKGACLVGLLVDERRQTYVVKLTTVTDRSYCYINDSNQLAFLLYHDILESNICVFYMYLCPKLNLMMTFPCHL